MFTYLHNVTVAVKAQEEHDSNVKAFLEAIHFNKTKTISTVSDIQILRYVVGNGLIKPDPESLLLLRELPPPTSFISKAVDPPIPSGSTALLMKLDH